MNNSRGADMLATLKPGAIVTVRDADGRLEVGRAEQVRDDLWRVRLGHYAHDSIAITESNIISIREG